jgi:hypothetical protein
MCGAAAYRAHSARSSIGGAIFHFRLDVHAGARRLLIERQDIQ